TRGDVHRHAAFGYVVEKGVLGRVEVTLEAGGLARPQLTHEPDRLTQTRETLLERRPLAPVTGGDLIERLTRSHTEEHPARAQAPVAGAALVGRRTRTSPVEHPDRGQTRVSPERLSQHRRVVAERGREHRRTQLQPLSAHADRGQPRPRNRLMTTVVTPRLEM